MQDPQRQFLHSAFRSLDTVASESSLTYCHSSILKHFLNQGKLEDAFSFLYGNGNLLISEGTNNENHFKINALEASTVCYKLFSSSTHSVKFSISSTFLAAIRLQSKTWVLF